MEGELPVKRSSLASRVLSDEFSVDKKVLILDN
jgi:hypothetical protein